MKYEAKVIPEGINTSKHSPLRELVLLTSASLAVIFLVVLLLAFLADYLVSFIPPETENRWFDSQLIDFESPAFERPETDKYHQSEQYLMSLVKQLRQKEYEDFHFTVNIIEDEHPNAFIVPGGHIFITTGLFSYIDSENGLAMVLSHEMAHQYRRHPLRSMGRGVIISIALTMLLGDEAGEWIQKLLFEVATISQLAFSREQEREADSIAVQSLIKRYGHAQGAAEFFIKISNIEDVQSSLPTFYQSHPGTEERINFITLFEKQLDGSTGKLPEFILKINRDRNASKD